jgi:outer membrane protein assembly factor BamB
MTRRFDASNTQSLRLWPGVLAVALGWGARLVPLFVQDTALYAMLAWALSGLVVLLWWLFFSRARWSERVGAIALMVVALLTTKFVVDPSMANAGQGMLLYIFGIPVLSLALVVWAVASRHLSIGRRRASMVAAILLACGAFTLVRTSGITGDAGLEMHWRWTPTPEERLLAQGGDEPAIRASAPAAVAAVTPESPTAEPAPAEPLASAPSPTAANAPEKPPGPATETPESWPGFRGPNRDGVVRGVELETDWAKSPPVELWRRPIGPGWSSFAVHGNLLFTQEQRGDDEMVSCYDLTTGAPVWRHRDAVRFYEANAGPGPRGTPAVSKGRVYALGATGILNALDARDGKVVWSRNAGSDTGGTVPGWGFTSSPLVVGDTLIVAASGRLVAYDAATGKLRWFNPPHGGSYSSPQLATIDGVEQILLLSGGGAIGVAPADGTLLWEHKWEGSSIVQPALTADGLLISPIDSLGSGVGTRRIAVAHGSGGWTVAERWTSRGLKPSFNDLVVHKSHAFGFDGSILASINLEDGMRAWKGGRYGNGQLVLLADQGLLLVLSEEGELALVAATPDKFTELARFKAIEGKTWNHPVLVGNLLLVRNGEEMAAFRLPLAGG